MKHKTWFKSLNDVTEDISCMAGNIQYYKKEYTLTGAFHYLEEYRKLLSRLEDENIVKETEERDKNNSKKTITLDELKAKHITVGELNVKDIKCIKQYEISILPEPPPIKLVLDGVHHGKVWWWIFDKFDKIFKNQ